MTNTMPPVVVPIVTDNSKYDKGIDDAKEKANGLVDGLSFVGRGVAIAGIGMATAAVTGLTALLFDSTVGAGEAQKVQAQLGAVLESTGGSAGMTAESVNDLASSLSKVTTYEDDAIVSGENLLLTFTNIGKDVFPETTEIMLDMSTAMGTDLKGSAIQLGKALNDPTKGMTALTRVGVTFTDEQAKLIESLQASGDMAGAQRVILAELNKEFGGSAEAAGKTLPGKLEILKNKFGNLKDNLGNAVIPVVSELATTLSDSLDNPAVQTGITTMTNGIAGFATVVIANIPVVISTLSNIVTFLMNNQGIIIGVLAGLGYAFGVFVYTSVIPPLITLITAFAPVIAVIALVGVAAYLLYQAWTHNFGGIQTFFLGLWEKIKPVFAVIYEWLKVNIPIAIKAVSDYWENTLLPSMVKIYNWMYVNLFPLFRAIGTFLGAVFGKAIEALAGLWDKVLYPSLQKIWQFLNDKVFPIFKKIGEWISEKLGPAFKDLGDILWEVAKWFNNLAYEISKLKLPSWLTPGSPTPLQLGLEGIDSALNKINHNSLPTFGTQLDIQGVVSTSARNIDQSHGSSENVVPYFKELIEKTMTEAKLAAMIKSAVTQAVG
jgi:hypothetical protein